MDEPYNARVVNPSDFLGPAWFGSVHVVDVERVEKVCVVGGPTSGEAGIAESAEAKR